MNQRDRVTAVIEKECYLMGDRRGPLLDTTELADDLGFDSLDRVELVMELEKEFSIDISDEDMTEMRTVGDAVAAVERHTRR